MFINDLLCFYNELFVNHSINGLFTIYYMLYNKDGVKRISPFQHHPRLVHYLLTYLMLLQIFFLDCRFQAGQTNIGPTLLIDRCLLDET